MTQDQQTSYYNISSNTPPRTHTIQPSPTDDIKTIRTFFDGGVSVTEVLLAVLIVVGIGFKNASDIVKLKKIFNKGTINIEQNSQIQQVLSQILLLASADRAVLAMFHNGEKTNTNYHLQKLSVTNEVTAPGIAPTIKQVRNIPATTMLKELDMYHKAPNNCLHIVTEEIEDPDCRRHLHSIGVSSMYNKFITYRGNEIGVLSVQYITDRKNVFSGNRTSDPILLETINKLINQLIDILINFKRK